MTETVELVRIARERELLDEEFASNKTMTTTELNGRLEALGKRKRDAQYALKLAAAERADAERAAIARASAPRPNKTYKMPREDARALHEMQEKFLTAMDADDPEGMRSVVEDKHYSELRIREALESRDEISLKTFAVSIGASVRLLYDALAIQGVRRRVLEKRIAELERAPSLKYVGTWRQGETYRQNSLATDHGCLWLALENTNTRPPGDAWKLIVQRGKG
jgi:hypothetical protein